MYEKKTRKFVNDTSGTVLLYVAFMGSVVLGVAGLAIDTGHWYATQRAAQGAADAAAMAAAYELAWSDDIADLTAAANELALMNGFEAAAVTVNHPPLNGPSAGNNGAIEIIIRQPTPGFFSTLFLGDDGVEVSARSVAGSGGNPICIMALEPSGSKGLDVSGVTIDMPDCAIQVNSTDSQAMKVTSTSTLDAASVCVTGGMDGSGNITPTPQTGCGALADPLASLSKPTLAVEAEGGRCDETSTAIDGTTETLSPGVYCDGIDIKGGADVTFLPGIYVVKDKEFVISDSTVTGTGVAFYLADDDAILDIGGDSTITLSAPETGELAGIVFFGNRDTPGVEEHIIADGSSSAITGLVYFPDGLLKYEWDSTAGTKSAYTGLIVRYLELNGTGTLGLNEVSGSGLPIPSALAGGSTVLIE